MALVRPTREHWLSFVAVVIVSMMGFGMLFQITQSLANAANDATFVSEQF